MGKGEPEGTPPRHGHGVLSLFSLAGFASEQIPGLPLGVGPPPNKLIFVWNKRTEGKERHSDKGPFSDFYLDLGVDSPFFLFNHRSFKNPLLPWTLDGFLKRFGSLERMGKVALEWGQFLSLRGAHGSLGDDLLYLISSGAEVQKIRPTQRSAGPLKGQSSSNL